MRRMVPPLPVGPGERVDVRAVQVDAAEVGVDSLVRPSATDFFLEIRERADDLDLLGIAVGRPDRERRAPVTHPADRPVDVAVQPLPEAARADALGLPVDGLVERDQLVLFGRRLHKPAVDGVLHERRAAAPVVRVVVDVRRLAEKQPTRFEIADERPVGVLEAHPADDRKALDKGAVGLDGIDDRQVLALARGEVVHAESGRRVDDARAVARRHIVRRDDASGGLRAVLVGEVRKGRPVTRAHEVGARHLLHDFGALAQHRQEALGDDDLLGAAVVRSRASP